MPHLITLVSAALLPLLASASIPRPEFDLRSINYTSEKIYSTPAHLAVAYGSLTFDLLNSVLPYNTHCTGTGMQLSDFFYGNTIYHCDDPNEPSNPSTANFTFERDTGVITVNQTWQFAGTVLGTGSGVVNLNCSTDSYQNSNWTEGQIYSSETVTCQPAELQIIPKPTTS